VEGEGGGAEARGGGAGGARGLEGGCEGLRHGVLCYRPRVFIFNFRFSIFKSGCRVSGVGGGRCARGCAGAQIWFCWKSLWVRGMLRGARGAQRFCCIYLFCGV
jgi:hypothetical protein